LGFRLAWTERGPEERRINTALERGTGKKRGLKKEKIRVRGPNHKEGRMDDTGKEANKDTTWSTGGDTVWFPKKKKKS